MVIVVGRGPQGRQEVVFDLPQGTCDAVRAVGLRPGSPNMTHWRGVSLKSPPDISRVLLTVLR